MGIPLQKRSDLDESCEIDNDNDERDANLSASLRASAKTAAAEAALADAECTAVQDAMRSSQQMTDGDSWYLLSFKWWTEWKNFAMYGDDDLAAAATSSSAAATTSAEATPLDKSIKVSVERPGPIDNLDLLDVRCRAKLGKGKPDASPSSYDAATPSSGAELSNGTGASSPSLSSPSINGVNGENGSTDEAASADGACDNGGAFTLLDSILAKQRAENLQRLKAELVPGIDYTLVPKAVWELLVQWYGVNYTFCRKVISTGVSRTLQVEVYPLRITFTKIGTDTLPSFEMLLSKELKLRELRTELCTTLYLPPSQLRMHLEVGEFEYKLLEQYNESLEDNRIETGMRIFFEVRQPDGTYLNPPPKPEDYVSSHSNERMQVYRAATYAATQIGVTGLTNLGNTCFMNSAIQCLSNIPPFCQYFLSDRFYSEINTVNPLGQKGQLAMEFGKLLKRIWNDGVAYLPPTDFKYVLSKFAPQFSGYRQHDAQELLAFLLDGLHEDLNRVHVKPATIQEEANGRPDLEVAQRSWRLHLMRNQSVVVDLFQGQLKSTLHCPLCNNISVTFDPFMFLSLPLPFSNQRVYEVTLIRSDGSRPMLYAFNLRNSVTLADFKRTLGEAAGIPPQMLLIALYSEISTKYLQNEAQVIDEPRLGEQLLAYDVLENDATSGEARFQEGMALGRFICRRVTMRTTASGAASVTATAIGLPFLMSFPLTLSHEALCTLVAKRLAVYTAAGVNPAYSRTQTASGTAARVLFVNQGIVSTRLSSSSGSGSRVAATSSAASSSSSSPSVQSISPFSSTRPTGSYTPSYIVNYPTQQPINKPGEKSPSEKAFPFSLRFANRQGSGCGRCQAPTCKGCPFEGILPNEPIKNGQSIAIDMYQTCYWLESEKHESARTISHQQSREIPLSRCMEQFREPEVLGADDMWHCNKCQQFCQATKTLDVWRLPRVLLVHLKRFRFSRTFREKLPTLVRFPTKDLDLRTMELCPSDAADPPIYDLVAISNHMGNLGGGHYTAYGLNSIDNQWYLFNDTSTAVFSEQAIVTENAYILVYIRRGTTDAPNASVSARLAAGK